MRAALGTFGDLSIGKRRRVVILGDMLELGEEAVALHQELEQPLCVLDQLAGIDRLILIGDLAGTILDALPLSWQSRTRSLPALDRESAAGLARDELQPGDWVLLKGSRGMRLEQIIASL